MSGTRSAPVRMVFSHQALPAIRPVNHAVDEAGCIVFRTDAHAAVLGAAGSESVVAFEADEIDPVSHTGWSVIVTGTATLERDPKQVAHWRSVLTPWTGGQRDCVVRIRPDLVTGYRLLPPPAP